MELSLSLVVLYLVWSAEFKSLLDVLVLPLGPFWVHAVLRDTYHPLGYDIPPLVALFLNQKIWVLFD